MAYSTIKKKIGICIDCKENGTMIQHPLIAGRCHYHYNIYRAKVNASKVSTKPKHILETAFGISSPQTELVIWYADKMKFSSPFCENCGSLINKYDPKSWHGCQAHILPKTKEGGFPSIATHEHNHMVLCMYGNSCHGQYDSSWLNASRMPVFKIAKKRFLLFKDDIAPEEMRRIPEYFLK